ncbi:replication initiator [Pedococcus sp. NPDC057267]|uniref:replication initiator n=1 Tax=Pedococcus sp. NPDC057267 TaxID=3346077 RepID=UPI00363ECE0F
MSVLHLDGSLITRDVDGVTADMAATAAEAVGVCVRPLLRTVTDRATGSTVAVPIACGSTRASVCPSCADKARRLRMHQCREGWHLTDDPLPPQPDHGDEGDIDGDTEGDTDMSPDEEADRRVRSTRRRDDVPDLPTVAAEHCSVGRTFTDERTGRTFRPSMFITGTLGSYGLVRPYEGVPRHPARYDYRRAALDALMFPKLVDRTIQNLRRCAGYKVQYFGAVEAQRRLAPHLHLAIRGTIPRAVVRQVFAATYVSVWWPPIDRVVYSETDPDHWPLWTGEEAGYVDPHTGEPLPSWEQALDQLDTQGDDGTPFHTMGWGTQVDIKGLIGGTPDSDRAVRYLCKYLTKSIAETYATTPDSLDHADQQARDRAARYEAHIDHLHDHTRVLPCSPACANWLRYGIQPKNPTPGLHPGHCAAKAHDRECLGVGGRRALVSRHWTGKTLSEHKADRATVVRQVLQDAGIEPPDADRLAADVLHDDGKPRFVWEDTRPDKRDYVAIIATSMRQARQWRTQYDEAKVLVSRAKSPPEGPVDSRSAMERGAGSWAS